MKTVTKYESISGIEIVAGMISVQGWLDGGRDGAEVAAVEQKTHPLGVRFATVSLVDGRTFTAWESFHYQVGIATEPLEDDRFFAEINRLTDPDAEDESFHEDGSMVVAFEGPASAFLTWANKGRDEAERWATVGDVVREYSGRGGCRVLCHPTMDVIVVLDPAL